ncbi:MAG TPA: extracellular solute-binding protein [Mobilitalea sp.]|nr:extracellular solute-binding protein [Mobilitalea sp.]
MKKSSKKLLSILLALTLVFSLTACGKQENAGTDTKSPTDGAASTVATTAPTEAAAATPTAVPDKYEAFDFGGRTITVGIWWDYFYTSDHTAITDNPNVANTETAQMQLDNVRRIEQKYKCKIVFKNLGWSGVISSINTSIAAGTPECDIYLTDLQFGIPAVFNGLAQELSSVALANSDLFGDNQIVKPLKTDALNGTYLFTEQGPVQNAIFMGYNATMIQDLGLEDPQELYKNGQWTWDKFAEMAKAGTRDTDGDGTTDVYGYGGVWTDLTNGLVMNNGGSIAGTKTEGLSSKPVMEALDFMNRLYNVDKSARPWNETDWNDNLLAWSSGKVMFWTGQSWLLKQEADAATKNGAELPFEYHVVPYPQGPSGDGTTYTPYQGNWYMIPVGVQEPGKVLQIFEEFLGWHKGDPQYRDDLTWFESCFTSQEDVDMALSIGQNLKFDPWGYLSPYYDLGSSIFFPIAVTKDATVAQAVESAKPMLQNALDNLVYKNAK